MTRFLAFLSVVLLSVGCVSTGDDETDSDTDVALPSLDGVPTGGFLMGIALAPAGGLVVPFHVEAVPGHNSEGERAFADVVIRATATDWELSDVLQTVNDVAIGEDGTFTLILNLTMPGAYSPTMSDVAIEAELLGYFDDAEFFCGTVTGEITTFEMDLEGSTFGAIPWEMRESGSAASCDDDPAATLPRKDVEDCPSLVEGTNTAFNSGGIDREFELRLPPHFTNGLEWPLVFAWHGFGGTAKGFINGDIAQEAAMRDMILVAPQGTEGGGSTSFDPFGEEKRNLDIVLFDDVLTCVSDQYGVKADQVYTTGMSNGGLMSGAVLARRASKLAAAAPMSGGIGVAFAEDHVAIPTLVAWGGPEDFAYEQDFDKLARNMVEALDERGHFLTVCEHALGHEVPEGAWSWVFTFLMAHDRSTTSSPYATGLPSGFPEYCVLNDPPK